MSRQPRAQAVQGERRRRRSETLDGMTNMRLALPPECRGDKAHVYRWANDDSYRLHDLHGKDWDPVELTSKTSGALENETRRQVGTKADGSPLYAVLMRKPIEYHIEDRNRMVDSTEKREDALLTNPERSPKDDTSAEPDKFYVDKGSRIQRRGAYAP